MAQLNLRQQPVDDQSISTRPARLPRPKGSAGRASGIGAVAAGLLTAGAVTLALLAAPGAAPSATMASHAAEGTLPPVSARAPSQPEVIMAGLPHRAAKSDRLTRWPRTPRPEAVDSWPDRFDAADDDVVTGADRSAEPASAAAADPDTDFTSGPGPYPDPDPEVVADVGAEGSDEAVPATRSAPVTADVNLRARPDNGAAVITVVPASSLVEVIDCVQWCEVVFAGERGWIYKSFVRGPHS